ncbi:MAG TPA: ATP-binding cassette domain-containing protein [Candidatus Dormibacteraeota bacterium]|nr:ATP-binding cassette domain-containing protein [Candidatus Dormibacteraeota bacterium]
MSGAAPLVECEGLVHIYKSADIEVVALQGLDLRLGERETLAVVGRSGSGKSTLMNILAGIEPPTAGRVTVGGLDVGRMDARERRRYRGRQVGYCWQGAGGNLVGDLTVRQNVVLPMLAAGVGAAGARTRASQLLEGLGIEGVAGERPEALSGDQTQRLALAVALANRPRLLLADEPTAELDSPTARRLLRDLGDLLADTRAAAILVTHDRHVERHVDRVVQIRDGRISTETRWDGEEARQPTELVVLDRAGRLQVPREYLQRLGLRDRVRMVIEEDHLRIFPVD